MIKEPVQLVDEAKKVKEGVDAKNDFDGYLDLISSAPEYSSDAESLTVKSNSDEK